MDIRIVPAETSMLPRMALLHHASFAEGWDERALGELLAMPGMIALAASPDDSIFGLIGFILLRVVLDEAEIITIAVDPVCRKQGIGKLLLQAGIKAARKVGALTVFLEVAIDNQAAIALYERNNFVATGHRPAYYRRGAAQIDAVMMRFNCNSDV